MTHSMTAYARKTAEGSFGSAVCELRAVNHRYLEVSVRLPDALSPLEMPFRDRIRQHIARGKVDCSLRFQSAENTVAAPAVNIPAVDAVIQAAQQIIDRLPNPASLNPFDVLRWPGVLDVADNKNPEALQPVLLKLLAETLTEFTSVRAREGETITQHFLGRLDAMEAHLSAQRARLPMVQEMQRDRLLTRFNEAGVALDVNRLEQEMVLFAQKIDVAEELERLDAHIIEVRRVLSSSGAVGRRLDFLMQEMNREANTLGSKSTDTEMTRASVELEVLIEQMREQVQNVE